ncbi:MAG: AAA family ATPase [Bacilli bacterium]|nr:AAA family ATPase [Bacilli bacterium]
MALNNAKVITVTSVKGGTGKSTTVLNLAGILTEMQIKTIVIDLDLYSGVIAASLNLNGGSDIYTLCEDFMNNRFDHFENYVSKYNEYIDVLAAPLDPRSSTKVKAKYVNIILSRLKLQYDVILIDTNHVMEQNNLVALDFSDEILYVITNDLMDLKNMKTMISIYKDMNKNNYKIILNEARPNNTSYSVSEVSNIIGKSVDYIIPKNFYNHKIEEFIYNGKIMSLDKSIAKSKSSNVFRKVIKDVLE